MTDLEKQIELKRERADAFSRSRTSTAPPEEKKETNFFANEVVVNTISRELKQFNTYQPTDIASLYQEIEVQKTPSMPVPVTKPAPQIKPASKPQITTKPYDDAFENITRMPNGEATFELSVPRQYEGEKFGVKINLRGKLVLLVASVAMLLLLFLAIFNAVVIGGLNRDINSLTTTVEDQQTILDYMEKEYYGLVDDMEQKAYDEGYREIPPENIIEFSLIETAALDAAKTNTNWFDAFCNFIYRLFGGR